MNPRLLAVTILKQVISEGRSLNQCSPVINEKIEDAKDRGLAREIVFGVLRWQPRLMFILNQLMDKPLRNKDSDINCLLLSGLYQLSYMRIPDHAAVSETVKLTQKLKKGWAKSLVNGLLRSYIREKDRLLQLCESDLSAQYAHPEWLIKQLQNDWLDDWQSILEQNNQHAAMSLRVNRQKYQTQQYLDMLAAQNISGQAIDIAEMAINLDKSCDVNVLPEFSQGAVSVQDVAAQQAADLMQLQSGQSVLDACAAPGGKTAHMLETQPDINLLALDVSEERCGLIAQTLQRLGLSAEIKNADAGNPDDWWNGELFDRILLDAPCSATGVIRRNPDIKIHRTLEDIQQLVQNQRELLEALWPTLKPGGLLVYATCSILNIENVNQVLQFVDSHKDVKTVTIEVPWGKDVGTGRQILPGEQGMDGFYYAKLQKHEC